MIRVLHFAHIINRYDIIDSVLTRIDRSRFEVRALTGQPSRKLVPYEDSERYETRCLGFPFRRRNYLRMLVALRGELRKFRPHVVHLHHYDENLVGALLLTFDRSIRYVAHRHYSDHIYLLTRGLKRSIYLTGERLYAARADRVLVPIQHDARVLVDRQGVPAGKVEVIPFGFDFDRARVTSSDAPARLRAEHGLEGKYLALTCCRLNYEKGLDTLLPVVAELRARHQDFRLVMVGSGDREGEIRRQVEALGIGDVVRMLGWRDDAMDWIAAADLVIQPSRAESFCQVLLEGLAFGKPVVMTPVGAGPEIIGDDERGRLFPIGDGHALLSAIDELASDRELGRRLGVLGRDFILEHFAPNAWISRYERLYEDLAGRVV